MKKYIFAAFILVIITISVTLVVKTTRAPRHAELESNQETPFVILLPEAKNTGNVSVEEAIALRRSVRQYSPAALTIEDISQILWAAQGITESHHKLRSAPSAGALYPLKLYLVCGEDEPIPAGVYKYDPEAHSIVKYKDGDIRKELYQACLSQEAVLDAPVVLFFSAVYKQTRDKYGARGEMYVHFEVGHAAQNVYLQATARNLGTVSIGAFDGASVKSLLNMPKDETPLYCMPIGRL